MRIHDQTGTGFQRKICNIVKNSFKKATAWISILTLLGTTQISSTVTLAVINPDFGLLDPDPPTYLIIQIRVDMIYLSDPDLAF